MREWDPAESRVEAHDGVVDDVGLACLRLQPKEDKFDDTVEHSAGQRPHYHPDVYIDAFDIVRGGVVEDPSLNEYLG